MDGLDKKILELNREGSSLRKIAQAIGLTHEGVRKRLKGLQGKDRVSTHPEDRRLTASAIGNGKVSTCSDAHESRVSKESWNGVNSLSTRKTTRPTPTEGVNSSQRSCRRPQRGKKKERKGPKGALLENGDLLSTIREILEARGIEMYPMRSDGYEGYQVKHNGQVIRFYVRRIDRVSQVPQDR